jgi:hypothetical protein
MNTGILFRTYFRQRNVKNKLCPKIIWVRIRIRSFSKVGSGQKSSGSVTLKLTDEFQCIHNTILRLKGYLHSTYVNFIA